MRRLTQPPYNSPRSSGACLYFTQQRYGCVLGVVTVLPTSESIRYHGERFHIDEADRKFDTRSMNWFPKHSLKSLRKHAIEAVDIIAKSENDWGATNKEKQFATIKDLRKNIEEKTASIGKDRVVLILNHDVPQVRSLFDLTKPRPGERADLLPKRCVEAMLSNIDSEIGKIENQRDRNATLRWRIIGIPGLFSFAFVVILIVLKSCHS
ncbi:MAG TPA: hypothetical protein VF345_12845 [Chthoniobacterales bacterium]